MSANLIKIYSLNLGVHRNNKRVWIESKKINETALSHDMSYKIVYDLEKKSISLTKGNERSITLRKNGRGVIDLNNSYISQIFSGFNQVVVKIHTDSIIIEPLREEINQAKAHSKANSTEPTFLEVFAGGGTLIQSLKDSGLKPIGAIELEDKYIENAEVNTPNMFTYCGDLAKLDVNLLPKADIVSGGIPCEGYSASQLGINKKEEHPTGSLGFYFLKIIDAIRPAMVLIEEVPNFGSSAMIAMVRYVLTSMGYKISEQLLIGTDYGSLTKRKRYVMVASIKDTFSFNKMKTTKCTKTIAGILEVPIEQRDWLNKDNSKTIAYSLRKEQEHIRKGDGFRLARTKIDDNCVATITKGYYKNRLTDPILIHPNIPDTFSWFTPRELARINGLPDSFILPNVKGTAGEIIGQGVCYEVFNNLGKAICDTFTKTEDSGLEEFANNTLYSSKQMQAFSKGLLFT